MPLEMKNSKLAFMLIVSLAIAFVCISFVYRLSDLSNQAEVGITEPSATRVKENEALTESHSQVMNSDITFSNDIETVKGELSQSQNPYSQALVQLRKINRYPLYRLDYLDDDNRTPEERYPQMYQQFTQWFYADPEAFIELVKAEDSDLYLGYALSLVINESNVSLLSDHLHIRYPDIVSAAYNNNLHIQNPEPFLEMFDQFAGNNFIEYSVDIINAAADIDYWGRRDVLIEQAITNPSPQNYFDVLERKGNENIYELAHEMWVAHTEDNYLTKPGNGASYIERIRTAYRFGVSESKPAIATLLNDRINVDSTIDTYTEVEGASDLFDEIQAQLVFDKNLGLWRLP